MTTTQLDALEATIAGSPVLQEPQYTALVASARLLAKQVDDLDGAVSTRLQAAYLSNLVQLSRITRDNKPADKKPAGRLALLQAQAQMVS